MTYSEFQDKVIGRAVKFKGFETYGDYTPGPTKLMFEALRGKEGLVTSIMCVSSKPTPPTTFEEFIEEAFFQATIDGEHYDWIRAKAFEFFTDDETGTLLRAKQIAKKYRFKAPQFNLYGWAKCLLTAHRAGLQVSKKDLDFLYILAPKTKEG